MGSRKSKKGSAIYDKAIDGCDIVINALEEMERLLREEEAMTFLKGSRGNPSELIERLREIQNKGHKISSFGYKIGEIARTTRGRLEGWEPNRRAKLI